MGKKNDIINIDALMKQFDAALELVAKEVGLEIETAFENKISDFYNDYTPKIYDRTGYMYYLSSGYSNYSNLSKKTGDYEYVAGIDVGSWNVFGNPYRKRPPHGLSVGPSFVYNISYRRGIHGFNRSDLTFKRDPRNGELLRGGKRSSKKPVYRKDGWKPGFKTDSTLVFELERSDIAASFSALEGFKNSYSRTYSASEHTPKPIKGKIPADEVQREFKKICKTIVVKINKAMGFIGDNYFG